MSVTGGWLVGWWWLVVVGGFGCGGWAATVHATVKQLVGGTTPGIAPSVVTIAPVQLMPDRKI